MSYAKQAIEELRFHKYTDEQILNIINNEREDKSTIIDNYKLIYKSKEPKVLNQLYKYIYEYLKVFKKLDIND